MLGRVASSLSPRLLKGLRGGLPVLAVGAAALLPRQASAAPGPDGPFKLPDLPYALVSQLLGLCSSSL